MKVVLFQPQIPQNTGNIARTCAVSGSDLVLVRPLGFSTSSRHLKRAGLDYWKDVRVQEIDDLMLYLASSAAPFFFFSLFSPEAIPRCGLTTATTSGKSMPLRLSVSSVGMPLDVQPRRW